MSNRTITDRAQLVVRFEKQAGVTSLDAAWRDLADFLAADHFSPGTRQTYHAHLRAWFHWLVLMDHRIDDPTIKLRTPKAPQRKPRPISVDQLTTILSTRMYHRTLAMVLLGSYQGLRVFEIAKFRGTDISSGSMHVVGKGGREDDLPVHQLVADIATTMPRGYWFPSHVKIGHVCSKSVSDTIGAVMERAGVPATPHALRHFFGTECLRASGGNLILTQQLMRHANPGTTALYTQVEDAARRATINALPVPLSLAA